MAVVKVIKENEDGLVIGRFVEIPDEKLDLFLKKGIVEVTKETKKKNKKGW